MSAMIRGRVQVVVNQDRPERVELEVPLGFRRSSIATSEEKIWMHTISIASALRRVDLAGHD